MLARIIASQLAVARVTVESTSVRPCGSAVVRIESGVVMLRHASVWRVLQRGSRPRTRGAGPRFVRRQCVGPARPAQTPAEPTKPVQAAAESTTKRPQKFPSATGSSRKESVPDPRVPRLRAKQDVSAPSPVKPRLAGGAASGGGGSGARISAGVGAGPTPTQEQIIARLQAELAQVSALFDENRMQFVIGGGVLGAVAVGLALGAYLYRRPESVEQLAARLAVRTFHRAGASFETRKSVYFGLPESTLPVEALEAEVQRFLAAYHTGGSDEGSATVLELWASSILRASSAFVDRWLLQARSEMREMLLLEARAVAGKEAAAVAPEATATATDCPVRSYLTLIRELVPPSIERDLLTADVLAESKWLPSSWLDENPPQPTPTSHDVATQLLEFAIGCFPGPMDRLVLMLGGELTAAELAADLAAAGGDSSAGVIEKALHALGETYSGLRPEIQRHVLEAGIATAIETLEAYGKYQGETPEPRPGAQTPYEQYTTAVDSSLLRPLEADAQIGDEILPGPKVKAGANEIIVLELEGSSEDASFELVGGPVLQRPPSPPPSMHCDPAAPGAAGSAVRMANEAAKLAHQQQWNYNVSTGFFALRATPSLCISVQAGCPHHETGCVTLAGCSQCQNGHNCPTAFDFEAAPASPSSHHLVVRSQQPGAGNCLEIDAHDNFQLSPLGIWSCEGAFDQANEWWKYDSIMGHLISMQPSADPSSPFVATACS